MMEKMKNLVVEEEGQGMVEYALIIALVSIMLIGGLRALEVGIGGVFTEITDAF
jgi:pilus assembly protein Flp/PilA